MKAKTAQKFSVYWVEILYARLIDLLVTLSH